MGLESMFGQFNADLCVGCRAGSIISNNEVGSIPWEIIAQPGGKLIKFYFGKFIIALAQKHDSIVFHFQ